MGKGIEITGTDRQLELIQKNNEYWAFFNSRGHRVKRRLTRVETVMARKAIGDKIEEDLFCYSIV